jgi:hypothetical protein
MHILLNVFFARSNKRRDYLDHEGNAEKEKKVTSSLNIYLQICLGMRGEGGVSIHPRSHPF